MRNMREKFILELKLLLSAHVEGHQQRLAFYGVPNRPRQLFAVEIALHQIVLHALMNGFRREGFVLQSGKNDDWHSRGFLQHRAESVCAVTVGKIQV